MKKQIRKNIRPKQLSFLPKSKIEFGGSLLSGKRKEKRILSFSKPMHFVFKTDKAKNQLAFVRFQKHIIELINNISRKNHVKVYDLAVNFNHLHMVIKLDHENQYKTWIRHLTSAIVLMMSDLTQIPLKEFFTLRPYSKIITWGRQFKSVLNYQVLNQLEVIGLRPKGKVQKRKSIHTARG